MGTPLTDGVGKGDGSLILTRPITGSVMPLVASGTVDFEDCLSLQRRLAYDALSRPDGRIVVLICEHPPLITIGRRTCSSRARALSTSWGSAEGRARSIGPDVHLTSPSATSR